MAETFYRFGVSALSLERKDEAYDEELMVDFPTGQMHVKRSDGVVVSHGRLSRLDAHRRFLESVHANVGITGDLYSLEFDDINFPYAIVEDLDIISTPALISTGIKKILVSVDMDCTEILNEEQISISNLPSIKIDLLIGNPGSQTPLSQTISLTKLASTIINPSALLGTDVSLLPASIDAITVIGNPSNVGKYVEYIIHSILVIVE